MRLLACFALLMMCPSPLRGDAVDRMQLERLRATHQQAKAYQGQRKPVRLQSGYQDIRAIVHAHSYWSHDSVGAIKEIIQAAHATNVRVVMFSNHPAANYDYFTDTEQGMHDGVLLVSGAETGGMLVYPTRSMKDEPDSPPQPFVNKIHADGGLTFVSHLEERLDWDLDRLTGNEIYNTHADLMDEQRFMKAFREPLTLLRLMPALNQYPQETFAAIQDYPVDYLRTWDRWCRRAPHTGVAANDAHHNQAYRAIVTSERKIRLEDGLGEEISVLDPEQISPLKFLIGDKQPGELALEIDLDPYERSFRHVSTHLWMTDLTREAVWDALQNGRAYVAFDWMADPSGFVYQAVQPSRKSQDGAEVKTPMGSQLTIRAGLRLQAEAALPVDWKLVRDGETIEASSGKTLSFSVDQPGVYRVEAWLKFLGEPRLWILSNPIYIRSAK